MSGYVRNNQNASAPADQSTMQADGISRSRSSLHGRELLLHEPPQANSRSYHLCKPTRPSHYPGQNAPLCGCLPIR
uniref:Uncharacterized protein n=1 Tax=Rhizophora mucronata TaxID=61149 RepID=A0A2P2QWG3_RHIMU